MKKPISFVVVADSQEAKIFEKVGNKEFDLILLCRIEAELDSNHEKLGRTFNSVGTARHGIEPHTDRREVERHKFAEKIAKTLFELEKATAREGLILLASHKMLEEMDNALENSLKQKITHRLAKDLIEYTDKELKDYIKDLA